MRKSIPEFLTINRYNMNSPESNQNSQANAINLSIRLLAIALLFYSCYLIIEPFITLVIWSVVLAVTLYPLHRRLAKILKGRNALSASIVTLIMLLLMIGPAVWFLLSSVDEVKEIATQYREGQLSIPPPTRCW